MDDTDKTFTALRPRLQRTAFRILGSQAQAQAVIDTVALRFRLQCTILDAPIDSTAWLVSTTSILAIERWRAAETWPEVAVHSPPATPNRAAAATQDILSETRVALKRLAPDSRLAFLLHDMFGVDLVELAMALGTRTIDCQSLLERARRELRQQYHRKAQ